MIQRLSARGKTDKKTQLHHRCGSGKKKEKKRERGRWQKENERAGKSVLKVAQHV